MSVYTPPALSAVDFALTTHTPVDTTPALQALTAYVPPALSAVDAALVTTTAPAYMDAGWELLPAGGTPGSAPVTGQDVAVTLGSVTARGAAVAGVAGLEVTLALGTVPATGAARAVCTGLAVPVTLGTVTAQGEIGEVNAGPALARRRYRLTPRRGRAVVEPLRPLHVQLARVTARGGARAASPGLRPLAMRLAPVASPWTGNPTDEEMLDHLLALT